MPVFWIAQGYAIEGLRMEGFSLFKVHPKGLGFLS